MGAERNGTDERDKTEQNGDGSKCPRGSGALGLGIDHGDRVRERERYDPQVLLVGRAFGLAVGVAECPALAAVDVQGPPAAAGLGDMVLVRVRAGGPADFAAIGVRGTVVWSRWAY